MKTASVLTILFLGAFSCLVVAGTVNPFVINTSKSTQFLKIGEKGAFNLVLEAVGEHKINKEAPIDLSFDNSPGIVMAKSNFTKAEFQNLSERSAELLTSFTAKTKGTQTISGSISFYLCSPKWCKKTKANFSQDIVVK